MVHRMSITPEMWEKINDECFDSSDVYRIVGLLEFFKNGMIDSYKQMRINQQTYEDIKEAMFENARTQKHIKEKANADIKKHLMSLRWNYRKNEIAFDWMNFSPISDDDVPVSEIWWYDK